MTNLASSLAHVAAVAFFAGVIAVSIRVLVDTIREGERGGHA